MTMLTFDTVATSIIASVLSSTPTLTHSIDQYECMAHAIYHEASNQEVIGQIAVGHLLLTRSKDSRFSNNVCDNVKRPNQFEYVDLGRTHITINNKIDYYAFRQAFIISIHVLEEHLPDPTYGADHYFNPYVVYPSWAGAGTDLVLIQDHLYMKVKW